MQSRDSEMCYTIKVHSCTGTEALYRPYGPYGGRDISSVLSWPTALVGCEGSASRPGPSLPPGKTRYPLYRRLGGPKGRFGQVRKILPPPGFGPRTVQPLVSRYTDWATRPTSANSNIHILHSTGANRHRRIKMFFKERRIITNWN